MSVLRYEPHIANNSLLPFVLDEEMTITQTFFNPIPNWHDDIELLNCRKGSGFLIMDGERVDFSVGDTVVICPLAIHNVFSDTSVTFLPLTPSRDFCSMNGIDIDTLHLPKTLRDSALDELFLELETYYLKKDTICRTAKIRSVVLRIMIRLSEIHEKLPDTPSMSDKAAFVRVRCAIMYIREHYAEEIRLEDIARQSGINKFSLTREFKLITGMSMIQYLNHYRCRTAHDLILGGMEISEAAERCGFSNASYFSKTFRKYIGVLPSQLGTIIGDRS